MLALKPFITFFSRYRAICLCLNHTTLEAQHHTIGQAGKQPNKNKKKHTVTSYSTAPPGSTGKTDVLLCDYGSKQWIAQRPLPDPSGEQRAELLTFCQNDESLDLMFQAQSTLPSGGGGGGSLCYPTSGASSGQFLGDECVGSSTVPRGQSCYVGHVYESPALERNDIM